MQQQLTEQAIVYSAKNDIKKTFDFILPEYLPGISRIVKTKAIPEKCTFIASVGETSTDISFKICVIYISEYDGKIKNASFRQDVSIPYSEPFAYTGEFTAVPSCFVSSVHAKTIDPRKLSINLCVTASATAYTDRKTHLFSPEQNTDVCSRTVNVSTCRKKILPETHFEKTAEISIDKEKAGIGEIIYTDACVSNIKAVTGENSVNFSSDITLRILYETSQNDTDEDVSYAFLEASVPIEDSASFEGISQEDLPFVYMEVCSAEPSVSLDPYGENRLISLSVKYSVTGFVFERTEHSLTTDAFIKGCKSTPEFINIHTQNIHSFIDKKETVSQVLNADIREMTDISASGARIQSVSTEQSEGRFFAAVRCVAEIIGTTAAGEISSLDIPVLLHVPLGSSELPSELFPEVIMCISGCHAEIKEGTVKADFEVCANGVFLINEYQKTVSALTPLEECKKKNGEIVIYYPSKGETLWDVAKKYSASPEEIILSNKLENDNISSKRILIIP